MEKKCFKCGEVKDINEFYAHPKMADGHLGKCKVCARKDTKTRCEILTETSDLWRFEERERQRIKQAKRRKSKSFTASPRGIGKYSFKKKACESAQHIPCPEGYQRHHWSYCQEHWNDIFILTKEQHLKVHRYTEYDHERKMYRRLDRVLLDTRESAEAYYAKVFELKDGEFPLA